MEPQIIDYYNEYPYGINIIDKMNQELEEAQNKIKELEEYQNKCKEYEIILKKFKMPRIQVNSVEEYKEYDRKLAEFGIFCENSLENGKLPQILSEEAKWEIGSIYSTSEQKEALKNLEDQRMEWCCKLIDKLDELTNHQNREWCQYRINKAVNEFRKSGQTSLNDFKEFIYGEDWVDENYKEGEYTYGELSKLQRMKGEDWSDNGEFSRAVNLEYICYYKCERCGLFDDCLNDPEEYGNILLCLPCQE